MTIIELCQEFDCDFRVVHEINTDGYIVNKVIVKAPANSVMFKHQQTHKGQNE
jgi:hypothetical protein